MTITIRIPRLLVLAAALSAAAGGAVEPAEPPAEPPAAATAFRVRPYLQNPAPDAMTIRWCSQSSQPGTVTVDGREIASEPVLCKELDYQGAEPFELRHPGPPHLHSVRVTGLVPATSYPYAVEQDGETVKAILTTSPRPGEVGRGGGVRLFFYSDSKAQPESRGHRADWTPSTSLPGGPRPPWVRGAYPVDENTGYRMNLALIASRAAESLRGGNPVLACVAGDLVESGGEQRDWDEFWRHNAGVFGSLGSRVPIVAALGDHENYGGPPSIDLLADLGGFAGPASLIAARKFLAYFEHPDNGAADTRHVGRYHRVDFGPVTLLTLDANNGPIDGSDTDTNHLLDRAKATHVPDYTPGSEQLRWLEQQLAEARERGAITFVQVHHSPFSAGAHGRPPGKGAGRDERSGRPLEALAKLLRENGVQAVFSGHDEMYEHSMFEGVHYYTIGTGGDVLRGPEDGVINQRQIFVAHDHAPERWNGPVLEQGGKHYGHIEVDVKRVAGGGPAADGSAPAGPGFTVTITPVHVFPLLDPERPGEVAGWERREYDDVVTLQAGRAAPRRPAPETAP